MLQSDKWPFIPERLSEIIDEQTLAVIEAGCSARFDRPMTIHDMVRDETQPSKRVDPINLNEKFSRFCLYFRTDSYVRGGNRACEECDLKIVRVLARQTSPPAFESYLCHMGVEDARHTIVVRGRTVGVLFAGQFRPKHGVGAIQKNVRDLGRGRYEAIVPANENVRQELVRRAEQLQPAPPNFQQGLQREAEHIGRIAEAEYDRVKTRWEKQFLETLRAKRRGHQITNLSDIQRVTDDLLTFVRDFCRCSYLVFFASLKEGETVLVPIAQAGVAVAWLEMLPHFNWRKAALSLESAQIDQVSLLKESKGLLKGIRGHHVDLFNDAACIVPMTMDNPYRSVLIFGPFAEPVELDREGTFLAQITRIIGVYVVNQLQILQLQAERKAWEDRTKLLTHHVRTALTPITTYVSAAKLYGQKLAIDPTMLTRLQDAILRAHAMCLRLGQSVRDTVSAHVILVEEDDLHFERFPLSVLVMNAAQGFAEVIQERQRELVIHPSVEQLPTATIDVARMSIALSNLIENALKYSFPNTKITIRASVYDFAAPGIDFAHAYVEIHDDGDGIPEEQRLRIFDSGVRGLAEAKLRRVPGTGLGLWEARAVLEAHGGAITVQSDPTGLKQRQGDVYHVTFRVKIPLSQPEKSRGTPA